MDWCERCGRYFLVRSQQYVRSGIGGRGMFREPGESICDSCLKHNEWVDETGAVRTDARPTPEQVMSGEYPKPR